MSLISLHGGPNLLIWYSLAVHESLAQNAEDVTALLACGLSNTSPSGIRIREETIKCLQVSSEIRPWQGGVWQSTCHSTVLRLLARSLTAT